MAHVTGNVSGDEYTKAITYSSFNVVVMVLKDPVLMVVMRLFDRNLQL